MSSFSFFVRRTHQKEAAKAARRRRSQTRLANSGVERLEDRLLLACSASFDAQKDALNVEVDTSRRVEIRTGSRVKITNCDMSSRVKPREIRSITISGSERDNLISLRRISEARYTRLKRILVDAGDGDDTVVGSSLSDRIRGGRGNDRLLGRGDRDHINGGPGDDDLYGNGGSDVLKGAAGNDQLRGGGQSDHLVGGGGQDDCGRSSNDTQRSCEATELPFTPFRSRLDFEFGDPTPEGWSTVGEISNQSHQIERSDLSVSGDFVLEARIGTSSQGGAAQITLLGADGASDVDLVAQRVNQFSNGLTWSTNHTGLFSTPGGSRTFRIERSGDFYELSVDQGGAGGVAEDDTRLTRFTQPLSGRFRGIRIAVNRAASLEMIELSQLQTGNPPANSPFTELDERLDFRFGETPQGWNRVGPLSDSVHEIERAGIGIDGDFAIDLTVSTQTQSDGFFIRLSGDDDGGDFTQAILHHNQFSNGVTWNSERFGLFGTPHGTRTFRLERRGSTYLFFVDQALVGGEVHSGFEIGRFVKPKGRHFDAIQLGVTPTTTIHQIQVSALS